MTTLSNTFGRTDRAGNVHLLDDEGRPVTTLDDVDGIYPVGSDKSVHYDHPAGIVITLADARKLSIEIDGAIEEHAAEDETIVVDVLVDDGSDDPLRWLEQVTLQGEIEAGTLLAETLGEVRKPGAQADNANVDWSYAQVVIREHDYPYRRLAVANVRAAA